MKVTENLENANSAVKLANALAENSEAIAELANALEEKRKTVSKTKLLLILLVVMNGVWLYLFCLLYRQYYAHIDRYHTSYDIEDIHGRK